MMEVRFQWREAGRRPGRVKVSNPLKNASGVRLGGGGGGSGKRSDSSREGNQYKNKDCQDKYLQVPTRVDDSNEYQTTVQQGSYVFGHIVQTRTK